MKTITIKAKNGKSKEYVPVNERLKEFRTNSKYEGWCITEEVLQLTEDFVAIMVKISDEKGVVRGCGLAKEFKAGMINSTSYVENCETSAWGRALGCIGIGIDEAVATADELQNAVTIQETMAAPIDQNALDALVDKIMEKGVSASKITERYKVSKLEELNNGQWMQAMRILDKQ